MAIQDAIRPHVPAGTDLTGMPALLPGKAEFVEAFSGGTLVFIRVDQELLSLVEEIAGRGIERSRSDPETLFCPFSRSGVRQPTDGPVLLDLVENWGRETWLASPVRSISESDYARSNEEWQDFLDAFRGVQESQADLPVPIFAVDSAQFWVDGSLHFSGNGLGDATSAVLDLDGRYLIGVFRRSAKGWSAPWRFVVPSEEFTSAPVLIVEGEDRFVASTRMFRSIAETAGGGMACLNLERLLRSFPDAPALARDAILHGKPPKPSLGSVRTEIEEQVEEVREDSLTPFASAILTRGEEALSTLTSLDTVVDGVRAADATFGIDLGTERAQVQARCALAAEALEARRAELAEELKRLGGRKGNLTQAVHRAEKRLTELEAGIGAAQARVEDERRLADEAVTAEQARAGRAREEAGARIRAEVESLTHERDRLAAVVVDLARSFRPSATAEDSADPTPATVLEDIGDFSTALAARGLRYPGRWPARFLIAALAARDTGALLLLAGSTGIGKTRIVREAGAMLAGAGAGIVPVRPEWLGSSDLLGYVDPIRDSFAPTDFVEAVRAATAALPGSIGQEPAAPRVMAPWFLLLDEMNLARIENFGADLLAVLEREPADPSRTLRLFPADLRDGWKLEIESLSRAKELDARSAWRLQALLRLFDPACHRQQDSDSPHTLRLPANLLVCGTLNTDRHAYDLSPKVFDRSFVVQLPTPTSAEVFVEKGCGDLGGVPTRFLLPRAEDLPPGAPWDRFPSVSKALQAAVEALRPAGIAPSHRLVRSAEVYLKYAAFWRTEDGPNDPSGLAADLIHLLLLPRLDCPADHARRALADLSSLVGSWNDEDLERDLVFLRGRANDARYGDFRGLA
ncbi:MAG: hypothetical protein ABIO70_10330 [Pseudomonadota bacterium]